MPRIRKVTSITLSKAVKDYMKIVKEEEGSSFSFQIERSLKKWRELKQCELDGLVVRALDPELEQVILEEELKREEEEENNINRAFDEKLQFKSF